MRSLQGVRPRTVPSSPEFAALRPRAPSQGAASARRAVVAGVRRAAPLPFLWGRAYAQRALVAGARRVNCVLRGRLFAHRAFVARTQAQLARAR
eukprot:3588228-Alexandrium_andersonii.AAC.1